MEAEDPNFLGVKIFICVPKPCLSQFPFRTSTVSDTDTVSELLAPWRTCWLVALIGKAVVLAGDQVPRRWSSGWSQGDPAASCCRHGRSSGVLEQKGFWCGEKQSCALLPQALVAEGLRLILAKLHVLGGLEAGRFWWLYLASFCPGKASLQLVLVGALGCWLTPLLVRPAQSELN